MFWISIKSGLRQWYVSILAFALLSLLDFVVNVQIPGDFKYYVVLSLALQIVKTFEKAIREWVLKWSEE